MSFPERAVIDSELGPITFGLVWHICQTPTCPCTAMSVLATPVADPEPRSVVEPFWLDLDAETRSLQDPEAGDGRAGAVVETWDEEIWQGIANAFYGAKRQALKTIDLSKLGAELDFPVERIQEEGELVSWDETIPFAPPLSVEHDATRFFIDDQYCVKKGCGCQNIILTFVSAKKIEPGEGVDESFSGPISSVRFDLKSGAWDPENVEDGAPVAELMEQTRRIKGLRGILRRRMKTLRSMYHNHLKAIGYRPALSVPNASPGAVPPRTGPSSKVGRNSPCPCGSGKKHKACCLRKSERPAPRAR